MTAYKLLLLPGDGIGPEVMAQVKTVIGALAETGLATFETETDLVGGSSIDAHGVPLTDEALARADAADAILLGAVGGPKWSGVAYDIRPEGRASAAPQGSRPVRESAAGDLLPGAGGCVRAEARARRGSRHHDRARTHRRRLFR